MGAAALAVVLVALVVLAFGLFGGQSPHTATLPALDDEATEPTLPPPEANLYGPTDFQYDGNYLTCLAGESVLGIDVSAHQQQVDWEKVADAGIEFVMIRVGYRGYKVGTIKMDPYAQSNYEGAKAAGLKIGVYFFSQAISTGEVIEEAQWLLSAIRDWELDMPVVYDWEYVSDAARTADMTPRKLTNYTKVFCGMVKNAGYQPMVYFNRHHAKDMLYLEELTDYPFWLAMYQDRMTYPYKVRMWQYTSEGSVPGIEGHVDINLWFPE